MRHASQAGESGATRHGETTSGEGRYGDNGNISCQLFPALPGTLLRVEHVRGVFQPNLLGYFQEAQLSRARLEVAGRGLLSRFPLLQGRSRTAEGYTGESRGVDVFSLLELARPRVRASEPE